MLHPVLLLGFSDGKSGFWVTLKLRLRFYGAYNRAVPARVLLCVPSSRSISRSIYYTPYLMCATWFAQTAGGVSPERRRSLALVAPLVARLTSCRVRPLGSILNGVLCKPAARGGRDPTTKQLQSLQCAIPGTHVLRRTGPVPLIRIRRTCSTNCNPYGMFSEETDGCLPNRNPYYKTCSTNCNPVRYNQRAATGDFYNRAIFFWAILSLERIGLLDRVKYPTSCVFTVRFRCRSVPCDCSSS